MGNELRKEKLISFLLHVITLGFIAIITSTHRCMTSTDMYVTKLRRATFSEVKEKMLSVKWKAKPEWPNSLFDENDYWANYFHADIIRFGDVGYILTTYGLLKAKRLQKKIYHQLMGVIDNDHLNGKPFLS